MAAPMRNLDEHLYSHIFREKMSVVYFSKNWPAHAGNNAAVNVCMCVPNKCLCHTKLNKLTVINR